MSFIARLKWLFLGTGEAPAGYKSTTARSHDTHTDHRRPQHGRDRNREGGRGSGPRDHRGGAHPRDREHSSRGSYNRDGGRSPDRERSHDRSDRPQHDRDRDRGNGHRRSEPGQHRRRERAPSDDFGRIERPTGGPSSTMMPAQTSMPMPAPVSATVSNGPERVGAVTHYHEDARVATVRLDKGFFRVGDWIEIQGSITSLRQKVDSIQLDEQPMNEAREGQEVGLRVIRPVKAGDAVVRLRG